MKEEQHAKQKTAGMFVSYTFLSIFTQSLFSQENNIAKIYFVKVKPDHGPKFAAAMKEHAEWRKQAGDPWTWHVHQIVNGPDLGDYIIRSGGHTWADLDSHEEFLARAGVEFYKTVGPHIEPTTNIITRVDTSNTNWYPNNDEVNLIFISHIR